MLAEHQDLFDRFEPVHEAFKSDDTLQGQLNEVGRPVVEVIREWEKRLCLYSEKGANARYSAALAEKFWQVVRQRYSHIDLVGCE